jgi:hypothetical protein
MNVAALKSSCARDKVEGFVKTAIRDFSLDRTLGYLLLSRNQSKAGHFQEEAMFHYSNDAVFLSSDPFRVFGKEAGVAESEISVVCDVPCSIPVHSNSWCEAKPSKRVAYHMVWP